MSKSPYHIEVLLSEINKRKLNNCRYSLRAFARFLGFEPSTLSRILANRQELSISATKKLIRKLKFSEDDGLVFIASIAEEKKRRALKILFETLMDICSNENDDINFENQLFSSSDWILSQSPDLVFVTDRQGRCLYVNEAGARLCCLVPAQIIGKALNDMVVPEKLITSFNEHIKNVIEKNETIKAEDFIPTSEGDRWFEVIYSPIFRKNGQVRAIACHLRDITDRKAVEEKLRFLTQAGQLLSSSFDYKVTLAIVADLAIQHLADGCIIRLSETVVLHVNHVDKKQKELLIELVEKYPFDSENPYGYLSALKTKTTLLVRNINDDLIKLTARSKEHEILLRKINVGSILSVPMIVGGKTFGTITLLRCKEKEAFIRQDVELANELGTRAAYAIDYNFLHEKNSVASLRNTITVDTTKDA